MKLYHATKKENLDAIMKDGLRADLSLGYVYMTPDLKHAELFGDIVFEIESQTLDPKLLGSYREMICDIFFTADYWHYGDTILPKLLTIVPDEKLTR